MHPIVNIAISAARSAGKTIVRSMEQLEGTRLNAKDRDAFAKKVEEHAKQEIIDIIQKAYPEHKIFQKEVEYAEDDHIWIIDAIDGIINYAHCFPHFSVSIAIKHKHKIQHATVYDPLRQELFTASRGEGAFLNERRIRISQYKQLESAILGTGFPHKQIQHIKFYMSSFTEIFPQTDGIRRSGSSALDLAYVAAGRLDGFWEFSLHEWNMAAGALLVQEAGGLVSDFQGEENYLETGNIVAGNPKIFKAILDIIQPTLEE